jgi:pyruvate dehydrogenase E2 component (dihydrolipoamide acetyltransferase)
MPRLSDSMEEGTIIKWLKQSGDEVRVGEAIAEIETDKATMTYEADAAASFRSSRPRAPRSQIGAVIARLLGSAADAAPAQEELPTPCPRRRRRRRTRAGAGGRAAPRAAPAAEAAAPPATRAASRHRRSRAASPRELGVDLARVAGSGPTGGSSRPTSSAGNGAAPGGPPAPSAGDAAGAKGAVEVIEPTRTQQLIARRMASAKATIPEFQVTVEVDAEAAFDLREQLRGQAEPLPSVNDLVIKACALALRAHPGVNAAYVDGHFERYSRVNIGVAVAGRERSSFPRCSTPTPSR